MVIWKKNKTSRNTVCHNECNMQEISILPCSHALFTPPKKNFSPKALHGSHFMRTFVVYSFYFYICFVFIFYIAYGALSLGLIGYARARF